MKDEIKKIIDRLEKIDNKEYTCSFEFADSAIFEEVARCFDERKIMADYIGCLESELVFAKKYYKILYAELITMLMECDNNG